jgi:ParB-like chromosome segregation protein Spo0J
MTVTPVETRDIPIAELTRFPGNARRGDVAKIRASIRRLGQYRSLVVRDHDGKLTILAGNHTSRAMTAEGYETARCEVITCTDDDAVRINIADNKIGELPDPDTGERYDRMSLAEQLAYLDGDFDGTGWTAEEAAALLDGDGEGGPGEGDADQDDIPEAFGVIVECQTEAQQARLLQQLDAEGFRVRALVS